MARLEEKSAEAEKSLSAAPTPEAADELAANIRAWATLTGPQRAIDEAASLHHDESFRRAGLWHGLACDLANESGAAQEALAILCALEEFFGELPDLGARIREDRKSIEAPAASARDRGSPSTKMLEAAIAEADNAHGVLRRCLDGSAPPPGEAPRVVSRLVAAFAAATNAASSEHPWILMRTFTLALHNEAHLTAPALSLTLMMLQAARIARVTGKLSRELLHLLETDARTLRHEHLTQGLTAAIKANRLRKAVALIDRLLSLGGDAAERGELTTARVRIVRQIRAQWAKLGLGLACATFMVWIFWTAASNDAGNTNAASAPPQAVAASAPVTPVPFTRPVAPAPPAAAPARVMITPVQPSPGETRLSQAELLWCLEDQELLGAANARLDEIRGTYPAAEYNAAVDRVNSQVTTYNGACYQKKYFDSDRQAIQPELAASAVAVRRAGEAMVMQAAGN